MISTKSEPDIYSGLKSTSIEERIKILIHHYTKLDNPETLSERVSVCRGLEAALELIKPNGWESLAPAWLRDYREYQNTKRALCNRQGERHRVPSHVTVSST